MNPGDRHIEAGRRMQQLGKQIGLGILSVAFALFVLAIVVMMAYAAFAGGS